MHIESCTIYFYFLNFYHKNTYPYPYKWNHPLNVYRGWLIFFFNRYLVAQWLACENWFDLNHFSPAKLVCVLFICLFLFFNHFGPVCTLVRHGLVCILLQSSTCPFGSVTCCSILRDKIKGSVCLLDESPQISHWDRECENPGNSVVGFSFLSRIIKPAQGALAFNLDRVNNVCSFKGLWEPKIW